LQWIPFYVLLVLKALDAPTQGHTNRYAPYITAAGAGAVLAVNAYTDWLYGIFLVLLTGLLVAWRLVVPTERRAAREEGPGWLPWFLRLAVVGTVAFVLVSPVFFPTLNEARQGYAQQPPEEVLVYSSDALVAFTPSLLHPIWC